MVEKHFLYIGESMAGYLGHTNWISSWGDGSSNHVTSSMCVIDQAVMSFSMMEQIAMYECMYVLISGEVLLPHYGSIETTR